MLCLIQLHFAIKAIFGFLMRISFEQIQPLVLARPERHEFADALTEAGGCLRCGGVTRIILVHGTMAGTDALGWYSHWQRILPGLSKKLKSVHKSVVDRISGDRGNYSQHYAELLGEGLNADAESRLKHESPITVERFHWTSENHHLGRANAAVRLADKVLDYQANGERVLLWGHSHAGNVFAILSNLLGDVDSRLLNRFFASSSHFLESTQRIDLPVWRRLQERVNRGEHRDVRGSGVDIVTFGTPIRYGWNPSGFGRLLHFVNHRPGKVQDPFRSVWPTSVSQYAEALKGEYGDFVQQSFIAGTDIPPAVWSWNAWKGNRMLHRLLEESPHGDRTQQRMVNFKQALRVPDCGNTLLVDYAAVDSDATDICGHAVYTETDWMAFHVEEISKRFYGFVVKKL